MMLFKNTGLRMRFCVPFLSVGTKPCVNLHVDDGKQDTCELEAYTIKTSIRDQWKL